MLKLSYVYLQGKQDNIISALTIIQKYTRTLEVTFGHCRPDSTDHSGLWEHNNCQAESDPRLRLDLSLSPWLVPDAV